MIDLQLHGVDLRFVLRYGGHGREVVVDHGLDSLAHLLFHQAAHFHDHAADMVEFRVELCRQMLF